MAGLDDALSRIKAKKKEGDTNKSSSKNSGPIEIDIDKITPDPDQPRRVFVQDELESLADSIKSRGVLQPITVQPEKDGVYKIQMGERRYRASLIANKKTIPVIIKEATSELKADQIIENIQRSDLTTFEIAQGITELKRNGLKGAELSNVLGLQKPHISRLLSILKMPPALQALAEENVSPIALVSLNKAWDINKKLVEKFIVEQDPKELSQKLARDFLASLTGEVSSNSKPVPKELIGKKKSKDKEGRGLIVKCSHDGRSCEVILDRVPEVQNNLYIKFEDETEIEVRKDTVEFIEFDVK